MIKLAILFDYMALPFRTIVIDAVLLTGLSLNDASATLHTPMSAIKLKRILCLF